MKPMGYILASALALMGAAGVVLAQLDAGAGGAAPAGENAPNGSAAPNGPGPAGGGFNQGLGGGGGRFGGGRFSIADASGEHEERGPDGRLHTVPLRSPVPHDPGVPDWHADSHFKSDAFRFVRIQYDSWQFSDAWLTGSPYSDYNFAYRLQQLTSIKVAKDPLWIKLTDPKLFDYPFIYMLEVRTLVFTDDEVKALRKYLLNGGFLLVEDFWSNDEHPGSNGRPDAWPPFHEQMKRVFPDREPKELDISHPIFHCVFDLKTIPQEPGLDWAMEHPDSSSEYDVGPAHYKAYFDDKGRMMAICCQNTALGDGWDWEGYGTWYFEKYSQKVGYPMGVNIVFYAMTH